MSRLFVLLPSLLADYVGFGVRSCFSSRAESVSEVTYLCAKIPFSGAESYFFSARQRAMSLWMESLKSPTSP